jgi:Pyridoxamine 5'-phosphate oxidase
VIPAKPSAEPSIPQEAADDRVRALIQSADTLFVASYVARESGHRQVDVSHRGGKPGFVRIGPDGVMTIPDFAGNLFFNSLGNFLVNPKGGLAFPDWETGDLLQLTGDVEVILDSPEIKNFQGAERFWRFKPHQILYRPNALPLRWAASPEGRSPNSLLTGSWAEVERRQKPRRWRRDGVPSESPRSSRRARSFGPSFSKGKVVFEEAVVSRIATVCEGYPYFAQLLGKRCVEEGNRQGTNQIDDAIFRSVLNDIRTGKAFPNLETNYKRAIGHSDDRASADAAPLRYPKATG